MKIVVRERRLYHVPKWMESDVRRAVRAGAHDELDEIISDIDTRYGPDAVSTIDVAVARERRTGKARRTR